MEEYLKVCASDKFAKYMASSSSFHSLDHAIDVAKDIFLNKIDVGSWLEALSHRNCFNTYIATATELTKQGLYEWGFEYKRKFGYAFVTCASEKSSDEIFSELKVRYINMPLVELNIVCREEIKLIELHLTNHYVDLYFDSDSTQEAEEKYEDISDGVEDVTLNSVEANSLGTENVRGVDKKQSKAEEHIRPEKGFRSEQNALVGLGNI
ncbi:hypothetical protein PIB30_092176 [Stylosanthes scabra]|uniref:2-oxo-4-hydroxy-4-carboxy-5-ureidoimidazoline decarboxylase n=1 Tax=Stylosanthes scabra TaxID=79078 RepID=A0ABU6ZTD9_9FABA|nr:hypothetical protein [Stylosanthes scabra]